MDVLLRQLEIGPFGGWLAYTYGVSSRQRDTLSYWPGHDRRHNLNLVGTWKPGERYTFSARLGLASGTPYTDIVGQIVRRAYNPRTHLFDGQSGGSELEPVGGVRNGSRYPYFQRLDLGVSRASEWRGILATRSVLDTSSADEAWAGRAEHDLAFLVPQPPSDDGA